MKGRYFLSQGGHALLILQTSSTIPGHLSILKSQSLVIAACWVVSILNINIKFTASPSLFCSVFISLFALSLWAYEQMASLSSLNQIRSKTLSVTTTPLHSTEPSILPPSTVGIRSKSAGRQRIDIAAGAPRPVVHVRAVTDDDEWGSEKEEPYAAGVAVAEAEEKPTETEKLKKALVDSFYGTDRGLKATSETRAEIVELITQLEAKNPNPAPTDALTLLNGKWILA